MTLKEKLERLKHLNEDKKEEDWIVYKNNWVDAINELEHIIVDRWFEDFAIGKLMEFSFIPVTRFDPYIDNYITSILEITLINNKSLVLEPISAITTEFYGRLDFYLRGNIYKKVSIIRETENKPYKWTIARSYAEKKYPELTKEILEALIDEWIS